MKSLIHQGPQTSWDKVSITPLCVCVWSIWLPRPPKGALLLNLEERKEIGEQGGTSAHLPSAHIDPCSEESISFHHLGNCHHLEFSTPTSEPQRKKTARERPPTAKKRMVQHNCHPGKSSCWSRQTTTLNKNSKKEECKEVQVQHQNILCNQIQRE